MLAVVGQAQVWLGWCFLPPHPYASLWIPDVGEAPAGCPGSMSRTENMSEEAVGENPAVVCLKAQCNFGSQAAAPFIDRALEEEPRACAESSTQFSFWVPAAFESQTHVQASPALPGKT